MTTITTHQLSKDPLAFLEIAQTQRVVVTRNGKPVAVLLGLEFKDEEDYALERDGAFWQMIRERRKDTEGIPLAEVKQQLGKRTPAKINKNLATKNPPRRPSKAKSRASGGA